MCQSEFNLRSCEACTTSHVQVNRQFQGRKSFPRVVKVWDSHVQSRRGQVNKYLLESSKCPGRLKCLRCRLDRIIRPSLVDKAIHTPVVAGEIHVLGQAVAGRDECAHTAD